MGSKCSLRLENGLIYSPSASHLSLTTAILRGNAMYALLVLLLFVLIILTPLVVFFINLRSSTRLEASTKLAPKKWHAKQATIYVLISFGAALVLLLSSPVVTLIETVSESDALFAALDSSTSAVIRLFLVGLLFYSAFMGIKQAKLSGRLWPGFSIFHVVSLLGGYFSFLVTLLNSALSGLGWGRPLRVSGKVLKPDLLVGNAWAQGDRPETAGLDAATKRALEALWLHDAKKEYASVPAFSRLGWQMAALAAPPELLRDIHIAAIQEIGEARSG